MLRWVAAHASHEDQQPLVCREAAADGRAFALCPFLAARCCRRRTGGRGCWRLRRSGRRCLLGSEIGARLP